MDFFCCLKISGQTPKQTKISPHAKENTQLQLVTIPLGQCISAGVILPPKTIWQCLETYLIVIPQGEGKLLASSEGGAGALLNILHCTALPPQTKKKDLIQSVNNAMDEKPPLGFKKII